MGVARAGSRARWSTGHYYAVHKAVAADRCRLVGLAKPTSLCGCDRLERDKGQRTLQNISRKTEPAVWLWLGGSGSGNERQAVFTGFPGAGSARRRLRRALSDEGSRCAEEGKTFAVDTSHRRLQQSAMVELVVNECLVFVRRPCRLRSH